MSDPATTALATSCGTGLGMSLAQADQGNSTMPRVSSRLPQGSSLQARWRGVAPRVVSRTTSAFLSEEVDPYWCFLKTATS
jgi:hypothetical protein